MKALTVWSACGAAAMALALATLGGCGGAQKKGDPMVADSPANDAMLSDAIKAESDGGGAGTSSDAPSDEDGGGGGGGAAAKNGGDTASGPSAAQGDDDGAQALLKQFLAPSADHAALTRALRPTKDDYKVMFDAASAAKVEASQAKDWSSNKAVIKPKAGQTEVKLWSASGADLAAWKGPAKEFPAGYKKVAKHLAPTLLFYRFKFVESGKEQGTAYDGLAFVNSHWVIAPKPWRAFEGGKGDDDGETKPKPKGKGKGKK